MRKNFFIINIIFSLFIQIFILKFIYFKDKILKFIILQLFILWIYFYLIITNLKHLTFKIKKDFIII